MGATGYEAWNIFMLGVVIFLVLYFSRKRGTNSTAHGSAFWMTEQMLKQWGMLAGYGLVVGRTLAGSLLFVRDSIHVLIVGGTGTGKTAGFIATNLLAYSRGWAMVFDPKNELYRLMMRTKRRLIRLSSVGDGDCLNLLDLIPRRHPLLVDMCRALAEALVDRSRNTTDPHWDDKAVQLITAILVLVTMDFPDDERSLAFVQDVLSNTDSILKAAVRLKQLKGIPARLGSQIETLFKNDTPTKEGASVISCCTRHLSWLDSEAATISVSRTTFDLSALRQPGTVLFLHCPPSFLDAHRGWLRAVSSGLMRFVNDSRGSEMLFLFDECSILSGLPALEQALTLGRSSGVRLVLAYQSDDQATSAFKDKKSLIYDNCDTHIYLGVSPGGVETAERLQKAIGNTTLEITTSSQNAGVSNSPTANGNSRSQSAGTNTTLIARALLDAAELMRLGNDMLLLFQRGLPGPVLARRIFWFSDPAFNPKAKKPRYRRVSKSWLVFAVLLVALVFLIAKAWVNKTGYWTPEPKEKQKWQKR